MTDAMMGLGLFSGSSACSRKTNELLTVLLAKRD